MLQVVPIEDVEISDEDIDVVMAYVFGVAPFLPVECDDTSEELAA